MSGANIDRMAGAALLAVAIAASDTDAALTVARSLVGVADLVEYRLDLMADFDLPQLLAASPLPAIITCRSPQQGGRFASPEHERRAILRHSIALAAPFVDIEAEALPELANLPHPHTQIIGSHHDFGGMIGDWASAGLRLRTLGADIVKLVGTASRADDILPPLAWLHGLATPGIGIAMGADGLATRLLASRFPQAFLSFGAAAAGGTAPGQIPARDMATAFGFREAASADPCLVALTPPAISWSLIAAYRQALAARQPKGVHAWLLPLPVACFGPGLLLACHLARVGGILCLPGVERHPALADYGLSLDACAWRLEDPFAVQALPGSLPSPSDLAPFMLAP